MNNDFKNALRAETKSVWGISGNNYSYDPVAFWHSLKKRVNDQPLTDGEKSNYMKTYIVSVAIEIDRIWPMHENEGKNDFQGDILSRVVTDLMEFYEADTQNRIYNYFPTPPISQADARKLHIHLKNKTRSQIWTALKKIKNEEADRALRILNNQRKKLLKGQEFSIDYEKELNLPPIATSLDKTLTDDSGNTWQYELGDDRFRVDLTEIDEAVLERQSMEEQATYSKSEITVDVEKIFDQFYLTYRQQVDNIAGYFSSISFYEFPTKNIWSAFIPDWSAKKIWGYLKVLDRREILVDKEKQDLLLFYMAICVAAMKQKADDAVITENDYRTRRIVISKPVADVLYRLIINTFLYFTFDLERKVFSRVVARPPVSSSDVGKFTSAIKDKPREMLKKTSIPKNAFLTPEEAEKKKEEAAERRRKRKAEEDEVKSLMTVNADEVDAENFFDQEYDIHEMFESYEVFEYLMNKIIHAFETGEFDNDLKIDSSELKTFLSEKNIELSSIFTFLNPMSQKDSQDYNYITQGSVSAIITEMMSRFKQVDGKLQVLLTKDENSLNSDLMAKATAEFTKNLIEQDFDIKRGDVSALAHEAVSKVMEGADSPFKVSIPQGSEYDSFRSMVDMNGPITAAIPFTSQGDKPFWDDERALDDKMVQMIDRSITDQINASGLGKAIAQHL